MKKHHLMAVVIAIAMLASCAKEKPISISDQNNANPETHLKAATLPVTFGALGTVTLTGFAPTAAQTVFSYTITAGSVAVERLDLGVQYCNLSPVVISITGGTATYATDPALNSLPQYKSTKWLKLAVKVPAGTTGIVSVTLKGYWDAKARNSFLLGSKTYAMASLESPVCEATGTLATVETVSLTNNQDGSFTVAGQVLANGGSEVYERGIMYSYDKIPNPYFFPNDIEKVPDQGTGIGTFTLNFNPVVSGGTLYVIAYAMNRCANCYSDGDEKVAYGSVLSDPTINHSYNTFDYEGRTYRTLAIGNRTWMVDNLAYMPDDNWFFRSTRKQTETSGIYVYGYTGTSALQAKATANYQKYGCLYNWKAAQTVCPIGWRLPTDADWQDLMMSQGMSAEEVMTFGWSGQTSQVGAKLKSNSTVDWFWNIAAYVMAGTNESGFDAIGSGMLTFYNSTPRYTWEGQDAIFWSSSLTPEGLPIWIDLKYGDIRILRSSGTPERGLSVRCVKETE